MGDRFYTTRLWRKVRRVALSEHPWCVRCGSLYCLEVHHKIPRYQDESRALDISNLEIVCADCHFREHGTKVTQRDVERTDGRAALRKAALAIVKRE